MREFEIRLSSVQEVQEFVALATARPFPVYVSDGRRQINGKSFMEMFCLNFNQPVTVSGDCTQEEMEAFHSDVQHFAAQS